MLQAGYTVSPLGACFTSPFFLLAALLDPEKSRIAKKPESNTQVTGFAVISENRVKGCEALGYEIATGSPENDFKYVGEQLDGNSGFYYNRARWMDPKVGRFVGIDPYEGDPQAPISLHRYLYGNSSPVNFSDPSGEYALAWEMEGVALSGILNATARIGFKALLGTLGLGVGACAEQVYESLKSAGESKGCGMNSMVVQFQKGSSENWSLPAVNIAAVGVTAQQVDLNMLILYLTLPSWWPDELERWLSENIVKTGENVHAAVPLGIRKEGNVFRQETRLRGINYRIDIENHGWNLRR